MKIAKVKDKIVFIPETFSDVFQLGIISTKVCCVATIGEESDFGYQSVAIKSKDLLFFLVNST